MEKRFMCGGCNMVFRSTELLEKHTLFFCIGSRVGGGGVDAKHITTPDLAQLRGQRWRDVDAKSDRAEAKTATSQTHSVAALQNLTDEFHRLRISIEENLSAGSKKTMDTEPRLPSRHHLGHSERLREMREMATLHERHVALIHSRTVQLEQQRDELAHQVNVVCEQGNTSHLESLLMELREQEERNEETLQQLADHLHALHAHKASVPADQPDPGEDRKTRRDHYECTSTADAPLSARITALRQTYMQAGATHPAIVAQMMDLEAQAQSLERNQQTASAKASRKNPEARPRRHSVSWELLVLEQENRILEEEIIRMQKAREKRRDDEAAAAAAAVRTELELIRGDGLQQTVRSQAERSRAAVMSCRQPPPPARLPPLQTNRPHAPLSLLQMSSSSSPSGKHMTDPQDSLGPAPFDPAAGFVIFYDLVLGLDPSQKALRLVAALYSDALEVGPPTPLPPVMCLPGVSLPYTRSLTAGNYALLSVKQPVPRIQPSPSLHLLVEVQAARDLDVYDREVFKLTSCGWTRLDLFDQHNQIRSGHWRVPVRSLPIQPSLSRAQLNSIPQVGNMALCVRLVNGRDADVQDLVDLDPTITKHYKYPEAACPRHVNVHRHVSLPVSAPQPTKVDQLSSLLTPTDHQHLPPTEEARQS